MRVIEADAGDLCGCCGEPIASEFAFYEPDLKVPICAECRMLLMFAHGQLAFSGMKECVQISGNQPIP